MKKEIPLFRYMNMRINYALGNDESCESLFNDLIKHNLTYDEVFLFLGGFMSHAFSNFCKLHKLPLRNDLKKGSIFLEENEFLKLKSFETAVGMLMPKYDA